MIFLLFLFAIFLSLFILYAVARHDFVLLRQSISLRQVFDNVFISLFVFFITSRIAFAFYSLNFDVLNPLRFLYLTKYWGILPFVGFLGMIAALIFLFRKKKNKLRIIDIYFIATSPIILLDVLLMSNIGLSLYIKIISVIVLLLFYGWFIKIHNKFTTRDGFITVMTIITYSLTLLAFSIVRFGIFTSQYLWFNILLVGSTLVATIFLILIHRDTFNKQ